MSELTLAYKARTYRTPSLEKRAYIPPFKGWDISPLALKGPRICLCQA